MKVLAIDPGTNCGWCVGRIADNHVFIPDCGVWNLKPDRHEGAGMRWLRLRKFLNAVLDEHPVNMVVFEEVRGHKGTSAAHIYGGIIAVIQQVCEERSLPYSGIAVGTIKKRATGKGNCGKEEMIAAATELLGRPPVDDNEADAAFCAVCALENYG